MNNYVKEKKSPLLKSDNQNQPRENFSSRNSPKINTVQQKEQSPEIGPANFIQPSGVFNAAVEKAMWRRLFTSARFAWNKLTAFELIQTEGNVQKLTALIQDRYAITREEANKQVKRFLANFSAK